MLTGTLSAAAIMRWPVSPALKKPPWPRISSMTTPSSTVRMSMPVRMEQSEAKYIARMKFSRVNLLFSFRANRGRPSVKPVMCSPDR